jgi:4a-hydroxytetrahydrobiopterin dehydratase
MTTLSDMPCEHNKQLLDTQQQCDLLKLIPEWCLWQRNAVSQLERVFPFSKYAAAMAFAQAVAALAEANNHHPAILIEWGKVTVNWWTHSIRGLHKNDFIMAAKTDRLYLADTN